MKKFLYNGQLFNGKQLAEFTGIKYTTLMNRIASGYTPEEAVAENYRMPESVSLFHLASHPPDWDGLVNEDFYKLYVNWCNRKDWKPETQVHFMRCIRRLEPGLTVVPSRVKVYGNVLYKRVVRVRK